MIADSGRNQTDLVGLRSPRSRFCQDVARGHDARRPIVVTSPAEAAALRTATRNLDQESIAHFSLGSEDRCRRREYFIAFQLVDQIVLSAANGAAQAAFFRILG